MVKTKLEQLLKEVAEELNLKVNGPLLSIPPKEGMGDYSTNIALQQPKDLSATSRQSSEEIANKIVEKLSTLSDLSYLDRMEVTSQGFINFFVKSTALALDLASIEPESKVLDGKKVLIEYGHVNLLKEVHIGHLRTFILGESLARILSYQGASVFRANYQGDIGLHIAKAVWGIKKLGWPTDEPTSEGKAQFLGQAYALGNTDYRDQDSKEKIDQINQALYAGEPELWSIYQIARRWSIEYLEPIYQALGIKYDRCFFESEVADRGKEIVLDNLDRVFIRSQGAVVFEGEKYGLHTRVFLNSKDLPTYEAKEIGLAEAEFKAFAYDNSIHVVANEQNEYMAVVFKAIGLIFPELDGKKQHLSYGFVDLKEGKMSSRTGNVINFHDLYLAVTEKISQVIAESKDGLSQADIETIAIGAIKFAYLKFSPEPNMVFDLEQSVSLNGDSGPYVQYAYIRTQAILSKSKAIEVDKNISALTLTPEERRLLIKLGDFDSVVKLAALNLRPNLICTYLIEISHLFNLFYQKNRVIGADEQAFRLALVKRAGDILRQGLNLLGIEVPSKM